MKKWSLITLLFFVVLTGFQVHHVSADVPSVLSIEPWTIGNESFLNITVTHSSPTSSHYVNVVEVDINGSIQTVPLTPQSTTTFVVQYELAGVTDELTVQARAHCNLHGWSGWSGSTQGDGNLPLPPIIAVVAAVSIIIVVLLLLRLRNKKGS